MNKSFLKKVGVYIMAISMISLNACAEVNKDTANDVCNYLEQQYGCKFIATHIGNRMDKDTATLYVHPELRPEVVFT